MQGLSVFAFVLPGLLIWAQILVCKRKQRFCGATVLISLVAVTTTVLACGFIYDLCVGVQTKETKIDIKYCRHGDWFMFYSDPDGEKYWGIGGIHQVYDSDDTPVRITYLPHTRFILKIERDREDSLQELDKMLGFSNPRYRTIYSHHPSFVVLCLIVLFCNLVYIGNEKVPDEEKPYKKKKLRRNRYKQAGGKYD